MADLKPSNILVEKFGSEGLRPVIMDFGLARDSGSNATKGLTESGAVMGTPAYMSPEQARGDAKRLDRRSDVYSLGATLYDVLVGKPPFEDQTVVHVLLKVMNDAPRPLRSHDQAIPEAVELIVSKCLNKEPEQRYRTARALAEDLDRYLNAQRVVARRLGYIYRVSYWARRNKALAALALGLFVSLLGFLGFSIRTRIVNLQKEERAKQEAALAQKLGQSVEALEWLVRTAYLLPLHDTSYEKGIVRDRMTAITAELGAAKELGVSLGAYVLGRGHLALHEWEPAYAQLGRAAQLGYKDVELDYALGRVMGELYSRALDDARKSGDKSFFDKRKQELRAEYLTPALAHLAKSRSQKTVVANYVEGLIDFYEQRYDAALLNAHMARRQAPWLYEAAKLEGDVFLTRALDQRDHGDHDQAERSFADAINRYEQAAAIGHSDHLVHEALAEAWLRWEEMDMLRGRDPESKLKEALAAADRALEAGPQESYGNTKKAFAYFFQAQYAQQKGKTENAIESLKQQTEAAKRAIYRHPNDAFAHEILGISNFKFAELQTAKRHNVSMFLNASYNEFEAALRINDRFPWVYNDYANSLGIEAMDRINHNQDPIEQIDKMEKFARRAISIDEDYITGHSTLIMSYLLRTRWYAEHGRDPQGFLPKLEAAATKALKINDNYLFVLGNLGAIYYYVSIYKVDAGQVVLDSTRLSENRFNDMAHINPDIPLVYACKTLLYLLLAKNELEIGQDPSFAVSAGLQTSKKCYQLAAHFPECVSAEAQLRATQAAWLRHQHQPFLAELKQSYQLAKQASAQSTESEELLLPLAQISFQMAAALVETGARPVAQIDEGLATVEHSLKIAVGWPRALAQKGALLLLRGKLEADDSSRQNFLRAADKSFTEAFNGNPLLKRQFGEMAEEAARLKK